jgi:hypothetical protein
MLLDRFPVPRKTVGSTNPSPQLENTIRDQLRHFAFSQSEDVPRQKQILGRRADEMAYL